MTIELWNRSRKLTIQATMTTPQATEGLLGSPYGGSMRGIINCGKRRVPKKLYEKVGTRKWKLDDEVVRRIDIICFDSES